MIFHIIECPGRLHCLSFLLRDSKEQVLSNLYLVNIQDKNVRFAVVMKYSRNDDGIVKDGDCMMSRVQSRVIVEVVKMGTSFIKRVIIEIY